MIGNSNYILSYLCFRALGARNHKLPFFDGQSPRYALQPQCSPHAPSLDGFKDRLPLESPFLPNWELPLFCVGFQLLFVNSEDPPK